MALANSTTFGLTGAIHTSNMHRIQEFITRYRAGLVSINGPTYGAGPHMPFGGVKNSGNGFREPGTEALDVYTEWKTVVVNHDPQACVVWRMEHGARAGSGRLFVNASGFVIRGVVVAMTTLLATRRARFPAPASGGSAFPITSRAYYGRSQLLIRSCTRIRTSSSS